MRMQRRNSRIRFFAIWITDHVCITELIIYDFFSFVHKSEEMLSNFCLHFKLFFEKLKKWKVISMEKRFKLTVNDVLEKQFNIDFKGYSSAEVDEFLDLVISDYQEYDEMIKELGDRLQEYENQVNTLKAKVIELEGKQDALDNEVPLNNVDILKRLTRLENEVFKR